MPNDEEIVSLRFRDFTTRFFFLFTLLLLTFSPLLEKGTRFPFLFFLAVRGRKRVLEIRYVVYFYNALGISYVQNVNPSVRIFLFLNLLNCRENLLSMIFARLEYSTVVGFRVRFRAFFFTLLQQPFWYSYHQQAITTSRVSLACSSFDLGLANSEYVRTSLAQSSGLVRERPTMPRHHRRQATCGTGTRGSSFFPLA